jgi:putative phosphoesterase
MKIAVLSDIHDNIWNLDRALTDVAATGAEQLFFLGDFCAPFTLAQIAEGFTGPVDAVFGNNDGDPHLLTKIAATYSHVTLHGQLAELEIAGIRIALNHYPDISRSLAQSGVYGAVFSGHDHKAYAETFGSCLWANPGEVMGRFGSPSWGLFDTDSRSFLHRAIAHNAA